MNQSTATFPRICNDDPCGKCMLIFPAIVVVKDIIENNACIVEDK